jgi:hypothetical protein
MRQCHGSGKDSRLAVIESPLMRPTIHLEFKNHRRRIRSMPRGKTRRKAFRNPCAARALSPVAERRGARECEVEVNPIFYLDNLN